MDKIINCINNTLKREEDKKKLKKKYVKDIKKYFSKLRPSYNAVKYKEYALTINIYSNIFSNNTSFVCHIEGTSISLSETSFELVEQIYNDREKIMWDIGKKYGCTD